MRWWLFPVEVSVVAIESRGVLVARRTCRYATLVSGPCEEAPRAYVNLRLAEVTFSVHCDNLMSRGHID